METNKVKFMHDVIGNGRVTAAWVNEGTHLLIALAWCSPLDQFSRKRGRLIAGGRLAKHKYVTAPYTPDTPPTTTIRDHIEYMIMVNDAPEWVYDVG